MMIELAGEIFLFLGMAIQLILFIWKVSKSEKFNNNFDIAIMAQGLASFFILMSFITLIYAFLTHQYQIDTVYQNSENAMSDLNLIIATWAGREGVLLLWASLTGIFTFILLIKLNDERTVPVIDRALTILLFMTFFIFAFNMAGGETPFHGGEAATNGRGLAPSLRSVWQQLHPPLAFLAYSLFVFPYALGVSRLIGHAKQELSTEKANRLGQYFLLVGWMSMSILVIAGSIWAYEANWEGFWAWDPIEVASLVMWLLVTIFFHSSSLVDNNHPFKMAGMTFGWVGTSFASFVVRSGLWAGFHSYVGIEKAIVFGSIFLLSLSGSLYAMYKSQDQILPDILYDLKGPKQLNVLTLWFLALGALINVVGLIIQMINTQITGEADVPYLYFMIFNAIIFFPLVVLLYLCDTKKLLTTKKIELPVVFLGLIISGLILFWRLDNHLFLFVIASIVGAILLSEVISLVIAVQSRLSAKRLRLHIIHLGIILMLFPYFFVDYGSDSISDEYQTNTAIEIEEFDITIRVWREYVDSYTWVYVSVLGDNGKNQTIELRQGLYKNEYWSKGNWISQLSRDIYFHLLDTEFPPVEDLDRLVSLQITEKPYASIFRFIFWYNVVMFGIILVTPNLSNGIKVQKNKVQLDI